jgi:hypothetical protein
MVKPETMMIDAVKYIRADSISESRNEIKGELYIVVLQRGWVAIGNREVASNCDYRLLNCAHIRVWGTTRGLGEIAEGGPTTKTILDKCPPIEYHPLMAIMHMRCQGEKWTGKLS